MAIYHYFPNRDALLREATEGEFARLMALVQGRMALSRELPEIPALLSVLEAYIDYALSYPRLFDYLFSAKRAGARQFPDSFVAEPPPTMVALTQAVSDLMKRGVMKPDDPLEVAWLLVGTLHGLIVLYLGGRFAFSEQAFRSYCQRCLGRVCDGLVA